MFGSPFWLGQMVIIINFHHRTKLFLISTKNPLNRTYPNIVPQMIPSWSSWGTLRQIPWPYRHTQRQSMVIWFHSEQHDSCKEDDYIHRRHYTRKASVDRCSWSLQLDDHPRCTSFAAIFVRTDSFQRYSWRYWDELWEKLDQQLKSSLSYLSEQAQILICDIRWSICIEFCSRIFFVMYLKSGNMISSLCWRFLMICIGYTSRPFEISLWKNKLMCFNKHN